MSTTPPPPSGSRPDKRKRSPSVSASESASEPATTNKVCQVCGDAATIVNYGALSCLSCRTFFRRNAYPNRAVVPCRFDGHCEVNMLTRRACTACRLNKCLAVGMSPDLIRKEDLTVQKRKSPRIATEETRSQLTTAEQTLISNITHAFETFSPITSIRRRLTASPLTIEVSFSSEIISSCYRSLQSFIRSLPDFQVLTSEEQTSLFHRNLFGVLFLGSLYLLRESGLFDHPNAEEILRHLYGDEALEQTKSIARQIPSDPILCRLLLIALAFSSHSHFLSSTASNNLNSSRDSFLFGTFRLFGSQNVYVELLWKYLSESSSTFHQAVQLYSNLIRQLLDTLRLAQTIYDTNSIHQTCINELLERSDADGQRVPLWGKQ